MHPTEYEEENSAGESKTVRADGPVFQEVVVGEVHLNGSQNLHEVDV